LLFLFTTMADNAETATQQQQQQQQQPPQQLSVEGAKIAKRILDWQRCDAHGPADELLLRDVDKARKGNYCMATGYPIEKGFSLLFEEKHAAGLWADPCFFVEWINEKYYRETDFKIDPKAKLIKQIISVFAEGVLIDKVDRKLISKKVLDVVLGRLVFLAARKIAGGHAQQIENALLDAASTVNERTEMQNGPNSLASTVELHIRNLSNHPAMVLYDVPAYANVKYSDFISDAKFIHIQQPEPSPVTSFVVLSKEGSSAQITSHLGNPLHVLKDTFKGYLKPLSQGQALQLCIVPLKGFGRQPVYYLKTQECNSFALVDEAQKILTEVGSPVIARVSNKPCIENETRIVSSVNVKNAVKNNASSSGTAEKKAKHPRKRQRAE
jgi:hypothetical protein